MKLAALLFAFGLAVSPPLAGAQVTIPNRQTAPLPLKLVPSTLELPATRVGEQSPALQVTAFNASTKQVVLTSAALAGPQSGEFALSSPLPLPIVLAPGASTPLDVVFQPSSTGPHLAPIQLKQTPHPHLPSRGSVSGTAFGPLGEEVRVNAGGDALLDAQGKAWNADYGYTTPGEPISAPTATIGGTDTPDLLRTARAGADLEWSWELPDGGYEVVLHFAELEVNGIGERVFDVFVEDALVRNDFDVFATVGKFAATKVVRLTEVADGRLDLRLQGVVGAAFLSAVEVRAKGLLTAAPAAVDFGTLDMGQTASVDLTLANAGLVATLVGRANLNVVSGSGTDFALEIGGVLYNGAAGSVSHTLNLPLAPGQSVPAKLWFSPSAHAFHELSLEFVGTMPTLTVPVAGGAGFGGDPYLHPVAAIAPQTVDYDDDGRESVLLDGVGSHTHEPGKSLVAWNWSEGGNLLPSGQTVSVPFTVGPHTVTHEIVDDNVPPHSLDLDVDFDVVPVHAVPGVLALYHLPGSGQTSASLIDAPPANADKAETLDGFSVAEQNGIGGTGLDQDVLVRLLGDVQVAAAGTYTFSAQGGHATRVYVDGALVGGPLALAAGIHAVEARFAVASTAELPLALLADLGGTLAPIDGALVTHDLRVTPPVINDMPDQGITLGGNQIVISGFGFFTKDQVVVHWGNVDLALADFTHWSADRIEFLSPPGSGVISVTVQTPQGTSNAKSFEYKVDGPIPIVFEQGPTAGVPEAIAAQWAPDGSLFVGSRNGTLHRLTFDANYQATSSLQYAGVSALPNREILGLVFDPFAPASAPRLYVAHTQTFAQGGGSFQGPSPYPGAISRLDGPDFDTPVPVVTNLPTSNHDHGVNGMEIDDNGDLLVSVGSNTNAGVKHPNMGDLPESPLSSAILKVELSQPGFNGALQYVSSSNGASNNDQVWGESVDLAPGTHVTVWASGARNVFDLLLSTWGYLYGCDNGPNGAFGVKSTGMTTQSADHAADVDELLLLEFGRYYGSPNRSRGRYDPIEAVYFGTAAAAVPGYTPPLSPIPSSSNGLVEYRSSTFGNAMRGDLLALRFTTQATRIELTDDKRGVEKTSVLAPWLGGLNLLTGPGGALLSVDYYGGYVKTFLPDDVGAGGLTVYDIQPWRAPASGGQPFVIGGMGFGSLANTSVTIGGVPAALTSVSATRITGLLPASPAGATELLDVVVSIGSSSQNLPAAFRYMPVLPGQAKGTWVQRPPMPIPLGEVASSAINGKLYVVGEGSDKTLSYDFAANHWTDNLAKRPFAGHHHACETYQGKWYLIGGLGGGEGRVQIYDPAVNQWSLGANMPWNGGSVATALIGGRIYAAGGIVGNTTVDLCARYDIASNTWTMLASMPTGKGRNHAAAGSDGTRFYVFGGRGVGSGESNVVANGFPDVQIYNPISNTWQASFDPGSTLDPLPFGRGGTGRAVFYQGELYVFGGETLDGAGAVAGNVFNRVDVYDPALDAWRLERLMPTARHGVAPVIWQGEIHLAGGGVVAGFSASTAFESFRR
jgi:glucose/arabinose dehydrogenase